MRAVTVTKRSKAEEVFMRGYSMWSEDPPLVLVSMDEMRWMSCIFNGRTVAGARRA